MEYLLVQIVSLARVLFSVGVCIVLICFVNLADILFELCEEELFLFLGKSEFLIE